MGGSPTKWILSYDKQVFAKGRFPENRSERAKFSRALHVFKRLGFPTDEHVFSIQSAPSTPKEYWKTIDLLPSSQMQEFNSDTFLGMFNICKFDDLSQLEENLHIELLACFCSGRRHLQELFSGALQLTNGIWRFTGKFPAQLAIGFSRSLHGFCRNMVKCECQIKEIISRNECILE